MHPPRDNNPGNVNNIEKEQSLRYFLPSCRPYSLFAAFYLPVLLNETLRKVKDAED